MENIPFALKFLSMKDFKDDELRDQTILSHKYKLFVFHFPYFKKLLSFFTGL